MTTARKTRRVPALVFSAIASGTALWLQNVLRDTWQIRTLPERVEEWLLLFVPLDLFEQGLQRLGSVPKRSRSLAPSSGWRRCYSGWACSRCAPGGQAGAARSRRRMWLIAMGIVSPSPARVLRDRPATCPGARQRRVLRRLSGLCRRPDRRPAAEPSRPRAASSDAGRAARAAGRCGCDAHRRRHCRLVGSQGGLVASSLPLAAAPTPQPAPSPASGSTLTANPTSATTIATPTPAIKAPTPTLEPLPNPPAPQRIARDKDGALTAAGRPKGDLRPADHRQR